MTSAVVLDIDVLVVMLLIGAANVFFFDVLVVTLLIPFGAIAAIWLIWKAEARKWDREGEADAKSHKNAINECFNSAYTSLALCT